MLLPASWRLAIVLVVFAAHLLGASVLGPASCSAQTISESSNAEVDDPKLETHEEFGPQGMIRKWLSSRHWAVLVLVLLVSIAVLGKSADLLVDEAVQLSLKWGMPRVIVGATVVSLGTTFPEAAVSVLAAIQGSPGLALGNSVGSIICDTGLILGLACVISPLPFNRKLVNRQGWVQFGAGVLLVVACVPWADPLSAFRSGSNLSQSWGFMFVGLLGVYMGWSIWLARQTPQESGSEELAIGDGNSAIIFLRLLVMVALVVVSSMFLIASATLLAERIGIPDSVIAATLVAFGTSLPELVIAMTAVRKNQGELAVGNVIGADVLNVLFVAGLSAAVTGGGLDADVHFFQMQFPAMLFILAMFRIGIWRARDNRLRRSFGIVLLTAYVAVTVLSVLLSGVKH